MQGGKKMLMGLGLALTLASTALLIAPIMGRAVSDFSTVAEKAISNPLLLAIVIGLILGNTIYSKMQPMVSPGIDLAKKQLLRLAIVLYGFRLTFADVIGVGIPALIIDVIIVFSTFFLTIFLSRKLFDVDRQTAILIGAGASICGAAAVLAADPIVKAPAHKVSIAVATVVLFGTISMLLYPVIYALGILPFSPAEFGVYIGATVHEVAQVVAAGGVISESVSDTAVITKMTRVMLLAPFLLMLTVMMRSQNQDSSKSSKITVPWFAIGFVIVVGLHSLPIWSEVLVKWIVWLDTLLLCMAMGALGLTTHFVDMKAVGLSPFKLSGAILLWLIVVGALIVFVINGLFGV